jgi:hypothetical protein
VDVTVLEGLLGFSPADLAANRDGRLSGGQAGRLWWSGLWRVLLGAALTVFGAFAAVLSDWFVLAGIGLVSLGVGLYLTWAGFAFMADAATIDVAWLAGRLDRRIVRGKNSVTYYAVIGPVEKSISRVHYDMLPVGAQCNLYYAPGCRSLLSIEPADAGQPRPGHPFGADSAHAWDRLRMRWVILTVAAFGLFAGGHIMVDAHPARPFVVSGTVASYYETVHKGNVTRHLLMAGDSTDYTPDSPDSYTPAVPSFDALVNQQVALYVNQGTVDVIALRAAGDTLYAGDYYLHPQNQLYWTVAGGLALALVSLVAFLIAGRRLLRGWRMARTPVSAEGLARLTPPSVRGLSTGVPAAVVLVVAVVAGAMLAAGLIGVVGVVLARS